MTYFATPVLRRTCLLGLCIVMSPQTPVWALLAHDFGANDLEQP